MNKKILVGITALALLGAGGAMAKNGPNGLPPGLQKKVERGGELPPGWKKKLEEGDTLDVRVYRVGQVEPAGEKYEKVYVEDKVYKVIKNTREIVDILDN